MFGYVFIHLGNHILGLISIEVMEAMRSVITTIIRNPFATAILGLSIIIHFFIAMQALYQKPFLHLHRWQQLQILSGIAMILLLIPHMIPVRGYYHGFEVDTTYPLILQQIWLDMGEVVRQFALVIVTWFHICLGLHFWLKTKSWYRKHLYWIYALAILWPTLALIGFVQSGYEAFDYDVLEPDNPEISQLIYNLTITLLWFVVVCSILMLLLKRLRRKLVHRRNNCELVIANNNIKTTPGHTILNILRFADLQHPSICGGRARCTTCRVRVDRGMENLSAIGELENLALNRIKAPPTVRLACQAVVNGDVHATPLLPIDASMKQAQPAGGVSGEEKAVVAMFVDLRGSTQLAEHKLPYDVLFILNQFFIEMSKSLDETNGHYAQFAGDGLMALYGVNTDLKTACRDALQGALNMLNRLQNLNQRMLTDLEQPLKMGIGLHCGEAIVGSMGPPKSPNYSAIGDNINIAARLEAQTKNLNCKVIISKELLIEAGIKHADLSYTQVSIRGRENGISVYPITDKQQLSDLISLIKNDQS